MDLALLGVLGMLALWGLLGFFAWTAATVLSRRPNMLIALPLCVIAAIAGGALVPALAIRGPPGGPAAALVGKASE